MVRSSTGVVEVRGSLREEMAGGDLGDERLNARRDRLIDVLAESPATGFPEACASDGEVEALYRFLRNPRVSLDAVLEPHLVATQQRCRALDEVLVIHDTTELSFAGEHVRAGLTALGPRRQGFWVHAALAVSAEGLRAPLGLLSMMPFVRKAGPARRSKPHWRERFRDPDKLSRRWPASVTAARTRVGAARRAIHLMDREGDSYELLATLTTHGDRFVVRLHYDRRIVPDGEATAPGRLREVLPRTDVRIEREVALSPRRVGAQRTPLLTRQPPRDGRVATVRFAARSVVLQRPRDHRAPLPVTLAVNVVYAWEVSPPVGEPPVEWWLVTTEPVETAEQILRVVDWYRTRWLIEEFFKCLKTGCAYEKRQLESLDTLLVALALLAPIAWQLLLLRHLARALPDAPARVALTARQILVLRAVAVSGRLPQRLTTREALRAVARLGGHLRQNGEPGWLVLGRGMQKLLRMEAGWAAAEQARGCDQS